ncbi:MAG: 30S ribosomal protein S2 [Candidatus Yonathbacteria bacterium]|nr:30S ribosomal protein S2 [Candidatus Yonathbacteria bacterium]
MNTTIAKTKDEVVQSLMDSGAQYGFSRSRRHPSAKAQICGTKNRTEIIDVEKSADQLTAACEFIKKIGQKRQQVLFVGNKVEAHKIVVGAAEKCAMPFSNERWLGGTLTNWTEMKKRIAKLEDLSTKREKNELGMYTKKERLLIDREIAHLNRFFGGLVGMTQMPAALFVVDPREEKTAVSEAKARGIPVVALAGTDCDMSKIDFPIVANDASRATIQMISDAIVMALEEGMKLVPEGAAGIATPPGTETLASSV